MRRTQPLAEQVYRLVRQIPPGRVMSYGQVAQYVPPLRARQVGRLMAIAPEDVPWWRVVGADGTLRIRRRDPLLAQLQRAYLLQEGVQFDLEGRVRMEQYQASDADLNWQVYSDRAWKRHATP